MRATGRGETGHFRSAVRKASLRGVTSAFICASCVMERKRTMQQMFGGCKRLRSASAFFCPRCPSPPSSCPSHQGQPFLCPGPSRPHPSSMMASQVSGILTDTWEQPSPFSSSKTAPEMSRNLWGDQCLGKKTWTVISRLLEALCGQVWELEGPGGPSHRGFPHFHEHYLQGLCQVHAEY